MAVSKSKYDSTRETTNLARVARIILGPCTDVLRAVLTNEMLPAALIHNVKTFLANLPKKVKPPINKQQIGHVYSGKYSNFDITLLYFLLRNICSIPEHVLKWGNKPSQTDRSVSANIERIRLIRNTYYGHATDFAIQDPEFLNQWGELFSIVKELEAYIGSSTDYQDAVTELKSCSMDPDVEQNFIDRLVRIEELEWRIEALESAKVPFALKDVSGWREDDKLFLETHNFQAMIKKVKNQPYVMFIGVPGSGKTATARHIALKLQEDGYDILSIKDLKDIDTYCVQDKKQVFVIDDVLGIFGFAMDLLTLLYKFRDTLNNLTMSKTKVIMTCREEVYRNKHIALLSDNFLQNHENLVLLHSEENSLNDQDKRGLLEKYKIDVNALSQADLAATSNMFPYLCRLYKDFSNYGPKFFKSPIPIILKKLDEMETVDLVQYASLVLLMANQNKMSPKVLEENGDTSYKVKKDEILKRCQIRSTTESFEFINALKRMEHTFTENHGGEFTFSHDSMFEMVAYHFGHRNPELMLEYMSSDFIANNITVNDACTTEHGSQKKRTYDTHRQSIEKGNVISLSINLQKTHYPHLAKRLYTDVKNGNLHNVFENEALKKPAIVQFFIKEIEKKPYEEIRAVFLSETRKRFESKKKNNDN